MEPTLPGIPQPPQKRVWLRAVLIGVVVLVVLGGVGTALYYFVPSIKERVQEALVSTKIPTELKRSLFVIQTSHGPAFSKIEGLQFVPTNSPLIESAPATVSPNASAHVYAETVIGSTTTRLQLAGPVFPAHWIVYLAHKGQAPEIVGRGYAPAFLDDTHVLYFAPGGIAVRDLQANQTTLLATRPTASIIGTDIHYSPDRTLVTWMDTATKQVVVARISLTNYQVLHTFAGLVNPILTNTALYDMRVRPNGTELWRYAFDGSAVTKVLTMPTSLQVRGIYQ